MTNEATPNPVTTAVVAQQMFSAGAFLPSPRVPLVASWPPSRLLAGLAGEELAAPVVALEAAVEDARAAVDDLERQRPGQLGTAFREALRADADNYAPEKALRPSRVAKMLSGDQQRWAHAHRVARYVPQAVAGAKKQLNHEAITTACVAVQADRGDLFAEAAESGWNKRFDAADAWQHFKRAEGFLQEFTAAQCVVYWLSGQGWDDPGNVSYTPADPVARGHFFALKLWLHPGEQWLKIPGDVTWPVGIDQRLGRVMPRGYAEMMARGYADSEE